MSAVSNIAPPVEDALLVRCPYCSERAGKPCETRDSSLAARTHLTRIRAARQAEHTSPGFLANRRRLMGIAADDEAVTSW